MTAAEIDRLTPPDRNRYADLLRLAAIVVVVAGHWLMAVLLVRDGRLSGAHLLTEVPATQWLTWVFQVMPLFFFVGGYANATAWSSAEGRGTRYADWVRGRAHRLLSPVVPLLAAWVPLAALLAAAGAPPDLLRMATQVVIVPTWFLAAYLVVVAAAPLTLAAHRRFGPGAFGALAAGAAVVDGLHRAGVPLVGWANFLLVWAAVHQLGYLWRDGRLPRGAARGLGLAAAGFAGLALLTGPLGYAVSMVGVDGAARSNNSPPTIALVALGVAQVGLVVAARTPVEALLRRPRIWAAVVVAGSRAMTVYLWHLSALVAVTGTLHATGLWSFTADVDRTWWTTRPLWFALLAAALAGLVALFGRFETAPAPPIARTVGAATALQLAAGVAATSAGLGLLAVGGLYTASGPFGIPVFPLALVLAGLTALGVVGGAGGGGRAGGGAARRPAGRAAGIAR